MTAALSKALNVHDPNWLAAKLSEQSYVRKIGNRLYAVVVSTDKRLLAVYVVTPRQMRVRRVQSWPSGVVDATHVAQNATEFDSARPNTNLCDIVRNHQCACKLFEEIVALREAHARSCASARATLEAAESALDVSNRLLIGAHQAHRCRAA